jgi:hypothetical protein
LSVEGVNLSIHFAVKRPDWKIHLSAIYHLHLMNISDHFLFFYLVDKMVLESSHPMICLDKQGVVVNKAYRDQRMWETMYRLRVGVYNVPNQFIHADVTHVMPLSVDNVNHEDTVVLVGDGK